MAQNDSIAPPPNNLNEQLIENFAEGAEQDSDFDYNASFEYVLDQPLNLNKADRETLAASGLLSDIQINALLRHREQFGDLIALYELQSIPSFDLQTIYRILPFVNVKGSLDDYKLSVWNMLKQGKKEMYMRWRRILEKQKGYTEPDEGSTQNRYIGDPNKYYLRYRHFYENKMSLGFTAEKDAGEEFFKGSNPHGFDFYSAHFFLKDYNGLLRSLAIGDYKLSMGQGLIRFSGFGAGKSSLTTHIKKSSRAIDKYSSVSESNFMRGLATTLRLLPQWEVTAFVSHKKRDANLLPLDTLSPEEVNSFSSFQFSGLHRSLSEIQDENALSNTSLGGILKYKHRRGHIAANALYETFDKSLLRNAKPYNRFYFTGKQLLNLSLDYNYQFSNIYFFGETAWSDNNRLATLNGLLLTLDQWIDLALLHRYFPKDYQAIDAQPFGETSGARNEEGLYFGLEMRPAKHWKIHTYFDTYRHPWLRFHADAPSKGYDFLAKVTFWQKRKLETYLQIRYENKEVNNNASTNKTKSLHDFQTFKARLHFAFQLSKRLTLRSRLFGGFAKRGDEPRQFGIGALQDVIFKPMESPLSFTLRYALFQTDGYDIRFYHYENDLLYSFSVPAYYHQGARMYFNLRYQINRNLLWELRLARTTWSNKDTFGSGLEEIQGNHKTEVKMQVRLKF